ncbi:MAG TPA: flotillin-like FloA family protein, partial [Spirochaetota bacterium]|nr:flotillin-like FloA family protein [Spirochaetota bacterium]
MSFELSIPIIIAGIILAILFLYFVPVKLWLVARFSGVRIGLINLAIMRIRRVPPGLIVDNLIT